MRYGTAELLNFCFDSGLDYDAGGIKNFLDDNDIRYVIHFESLESAIEYNNLDTLKYCLNAALFTTNLIWAAGRLNLKITRELVRAGADISAIL